MMPSPRRIALALLVGVVSAALVLAVGFAYGWIIDHTPWTSVLNPPEPPYVSGGDMARAIGIILSALALAFAPFAYLSLTEAPDA